MESNIYIPKISVIIPVYNVEKWLPRCLLSIRRQTYSNIEIILIDDGSTDESGKLCDYFQKEDNRIKVVHKSNGGLSDARNVGIKKCTGEFVCFVDSDDWIEPLYIEILYKVMCENAVDISGCSYRKCIEDEDYENILAEYTTHCYTGLEIMSSLIDNTIQQVVWNKLYKKSLIENILFENGKYHEDEFWTYQVFSTILKYAECSFVGYNYFQRANSIMGENYSLKRLDAVEAKLNRQAFLEQNMPDLVAKGNVNLIFTCLFHGQNALILPRDEKKKAFAYLKKVMKERKISKEEIKELRTTHKIWIIMAKISLEFTCRIRKLLRIGY